jgi:hypothetical protein
MTQQHEIDSYYSNHLNVLFYFISILTIVLLIFNLFKALILSIINYFSNSLKKSIKLSSKLSFILNEELNNEAIKLNYLNIPTSDDFQKENMNFHKLSIRSTATLMSKKSTTTMDNQHHLLGNNQIHENSSITKLLQRVNQEKEELDYLIKQKNGKYDL